MSTRDLWNRYARYFNVEEGIVFPADKPELDFYTQLRKEYTGQCLEIGAGSGRLAGSLQGKSVTVALEPSDSMLHDWAASDCKLAIRIQGTGEKMPFRSGSFPVVVFPYNGLQCVPEEDIRQIKEDILAKYAHESSAWYSTSRLWDDGIIDPMDTRKVVAMGIAMSLNKPYPDPKTGVYRM